MEETKRVFKLTRNSYIVVCGVGETDEVSIAVVALLLRFFSTKSLDVGIEQLSGRATASANKALFVPPLR
ncbi:hypothetical protein Y032_0001g389 [Ancylostoma ceylanicum]|uniref:Uncharacterized protein n=1 Tax=Ancylostoma ceylanicum TaxID=53326 RepID=A0A016W3F8_9BILA|nr:hypothetical protein Y032_0001g389 [Ancylostoma ceylanicum]